MKINTLPTRLKHALELKAVFDRYTSGQATTADKTQVKRQNLHWAWIARKNAGLGAAKQKQLELRRAKLPYLMSLAEKQGNTYRLAIICAEYFNLYG